MGTNKTIKALTRKRVVSVEESIISPQVDMDQIGDIGAIKAMVAEKGKHRGLGCTSVMEKVHQMVAPLKSAMVFLLRIFNILLLWIIIRGISITPMTQSRSSPLSNPLIGSQLWQ